MRLNRNPRKHHGFQRLFLSILFLVCTDAAWAQLTFDKSILRQAYQHADGLYSYAPSIVDQGDVQYIWSCHNHDPFVVRDDIVMSKPEKGHLTQDRSVLVHSFFGWDSFHVCDPTVLRTDIVFNKTVYHWVMFFWE